MCGSGGGADDGIRRECLSITADACTQLGWQNTWESDSPRLRHPGTRRPPGRSAKNASKMKRKPRFRPSSEELQENRRVHLHQENVKFVKKSSREGGEEGGEGDRGHCLVLWLLLIAWCPSVCVCVSVCVWGGGRLRFGVRGGWGLCVLFCILCLCFFIMCLFFLWTMTKRALRVNSQSCVWWAPSGCAETEKNRLPENAKQAVGSISRSMQRTNQKASNSGACWSWCRGTRRRG